MPTRKAPKPRDPTAGAEAKRPPRRKTPRQPLQERGRARFEALVDALEALLAEQEPDQIGLYQIAERAGMPPASAYHFFPTKNAAFLALAERYLEHFRRTGLQPIDVAEGSWQDAFRAGHGRAVAYYNAHPPAMKLLFGAQPLLEISFADNTANQDIANQVLGEFHRAFHLPFIRNPERKFLIGMAIADTIWRISFQENRMITPDYAEEATRATIAYFRTFLPDNLERRAPAG